MSWFARIEERCAAFIERAFANMFPSDLEPAQIARKLVATMEARSQQGDGGISAPSHYDVYVNPLDFARLREHREYLELEWSALLADVAQRVGIRLESGKPEVLLNERDTVPAGAIQIRCREVEPEANAGEFMLHVIGAKMGGSYLVNGAARVGRSSESDIPLADPSVSRNHALLDVRDGRLFVYDAGSTNGTWVNGEPAAQAELRPGDTVAFGKTALRVEAVTP